MNKQIVLLITISFIFFILALPTQVLASPVFGPRTTIASEDGHVWRSGVPLRQPEKGSDYTDLLTVSYYSDGKMLHVTYWVDEVVLPEPNKIVSYLILVDADFNKETGINGIDYGTRIFFENGTWKKETYEWSRFLNKYSERTINSQHSVTGFFDKDRNFVNLSLDLENIGSPEKYRIIFVTSEKSENSTEKFDHSRWITIPKPQFSFLTIPEDVTILQGDKNDFEVQISAEPLGDYLVTFQQKFPKLDYGVYFVKDKKFLCIEGEPECFDFDENLIKKEGDVLCNSLKDEFNLSNETKGCIFVEFNEEKASIQGRVGVVGLKISSTNDVEIGSHTMRIPISIEIDPLKKEGKNPIADLANNTIIPSTVGMRQPGEDVATDFIFSVSVLPQPTLAEQVGEVLNPWEGPINVITLIVGGLAAVAIWLLRTRKPQGKSAG